MIWNFDNSYGRLPETFYVKLRPVPVPAPQLVMVNDALAKSIGLDLQLLPEQQWAAIFAGNLLPEGAEPLAQAYAGHQFGHFTMLGDGRAILLGEQITPDGRRLDIQLKGSGQTPFSRRGDGRAVLAPMLREYIISEAMFALGIPTTRSLAVVTTGETVQRATPLVGAILTRVAASHLRVGTFEYISAVKDVASLQILADYAIARHFPACAKSDNPYLAFLNQVIQRQALLLANWQQLGFIHGVMNTDNMAISGETIDYGPCAFMDTYDPATVFSSIDLNGRYAYGNQPNIAQWNLARFAEALLPVLDPNIEQAIAMAEKAIASFAEQFQHCLLTVMRKKIGLFNEEPQDLQLIQSLLDWMYSNHADYTNSFRKLASVSLLDDPIFQHTTFLDWHAQWQERLTRNSQAMAASRDLMNANNPAVIPRNYQVEAALAAAEQGNFSLLHRLLAVLSKPYDDIAAYADYRRPPPPSESAYQTFCGT